MAHMYKLQSQLASAIKQNDHPTIEYLLGVKNLNVNSKTEYGYPIYLAASWGSNIQTLRLLLDAGADPNLPSNKSMSPLQYCISGKDVEKVKLLVKRGADVNYQDGPRKSSPLHTSILLRTKDITKVLLDSKANLNAQDDEGSTPIHKLISRFAGSEDSICKMLIHAGANLSLRDNLGYTPLHLAVCKNNILVVVALLERGADPRAVTEQKESALHLTCRNKKSKLELMEILIRAGVPIESRDNAGCTPLHTAVNNRLAKAVFYLVKAGANVNSLDCLGRRPIYKASHTYYQNEKCLNILMTAGSIVTKEDLPVEAEDAGERFVLVAKYTDSLADFMEHRSCHTQSLREICILTIRGTLAPHLQINAYLLPVPYLLQKEIALETLKLDDLSKFELKTT